MVQKIHHNNISTRLYYSSRDVFNVKSVYVLGVSVLSEWWQFNKKKIPSITIVEIDVTKKSIFD